jgi:hypothetical protein
MVHNAGNLPHSDSPAACAAQCQGWRYVAVQDGQDCFCGNDTGYASQGPSVHCTTPCAGNASLKCGGPCANSVYWNSKGPAPAPPSPGPPSPPLPAAGSEADPSPHDIVWDSPSTTGARGALPLGSGECSASVWVEPNGDVLIYTTKSDSFDELSSRDKLARIRVRLEPRLQTATNFTQRLFLRNASVAVEVWLWSCLWMPTPRRCASALGGNDASRWRPTLRFGERGRLEGKATFVLDTAAPCGTVPAMCY